MYIIGVKIRNVNISNKKLKVTEMAEKKLNSIKAEPILGSSPMAKSLNRAVVKLAENDNNIFIFGEKGTGKEFIARQIYMQSARRKHNFVVIDCAALGKTIASKELYGVAGEVDQAGEPVLGLLEQANHGVLYLKNLDHMSSEYQEEFLRIIRYNAIRRLNSEENITLDLRIFAASDRELKHDMEMGRFKKELYYLLNTFTLYIPPLRERKQDIPELFAYFMKRVCAELGREEPAVPSEIFESLLDYEWKGNIGELESTVQTLVQMSPKDRLSPEFLPFRIRKHPLDILEPINLKGIISDIETFLIKKALRKFDGNQVKAAKLLGVPEATLRFKMKKHSISSR